MSSAPSHMFGACLIAILAATAAPAHADSFAYMAAGNDDFGVLDLTTGTFNPCGNTGTLLAGLGEVAKGALYAASYGSSTIYSVDPGSGSLTAIGTTGLVVVDFGSTSKSLYALDAIGTLYSIDATTAVATRIGSTGLSLASTFGFSSGSSKLYFQNGTQLYTLSTKSGKAKPAGNGSVALGALVVANSQLYGGSATAPPSIYSVNATNGTETQGPPVVGESSSVWGLAPTPKKSTGACSP